MVTITWGLLMKRFRSLKSFLNSEVRCCYYKYRLRHSKHLRVLVSNKLFREFARDVVNKIRAIHDEIVNTVSIEPLPETEWLRMKRNLRKVARTVQPEEEFSISVCYEVSNDYELSIVVDVFIK